MYGPMPWGTWSALVAPNVGRDHQSLHAGKRYQVVLAFQDHAGHLHPVGETWTFLGHAFLPYEDGLSWFVTLDGVQEWHIPMQWRSEAEGEVIDNLERYLQPIP